jgi:hypothetical protein
MQILIIKFKKFNHIIYLHHSAKKSTMHFLIINISCEEKMDFFWMSWSRSDNLAPLHNLPYYQIFYPINDIWSIIKSFQIFFWKEIENNVEWKFVIVFCMHMRWAWMYLFFQIDQIFLPCFGNIILLQHPLLHMYAAINVRIIRPPPIQL